MNLKEISKLVNDNLREIKDFPKKGISFKDITTVLNNKNVFYELIEFLKTRYENKNIDYIVGLDARGFIFGSALAYAIKCGFVPIRKKGKLPSKCLSQSYDLEYGQDTLEIHIDAFKNDSFKSKQANILLIDDLLATGGTAKASYDLLTKLDVNIVEACFIINLVFLDGKKKLNDIDVFSIVDII